MIESDGIPFARAASSPIAPELRRLGARIQARGLPIGLVLRDTAGTAVHVGPAQPELEVEVRTRRGLSALRTLNELSVIDAYLNGDLDIEGDLLQAMELRTVLRDNRLPLRAWSVLKPALHGRRRDNPSAVAMHYDSDNVQLIGIDTTYHLYTPGIYGNDDETLELAAAQKLASAFDTLQLRPGASVLDVGCGWGGFLRYCAERQVDATGISLSRHQLAHTRAELESRALRGSALYADFFSFDPRRRFDAVNMMGVLEELSDYPVVLRRLSDWVRPGGLVYLDFAAAAQRFQVSSFVAKYVWPGAFRMVYLPQFIAAVNQSPFELVAVYEDRRNYHLWAKKVHERWVAAHLDVVAAADERTYRLMRVLFASTAYIMGPRSTRATAYRVVLRLRQTGARLGELTAGGESARRGLANRLPALIRRALI
jgi:cyclopropane-fatty-acyl-phospholipid synthase